MSVEYQVNEIAVAGSRRKFYYQSVPDQHQILLSVRLE